MTRRARDAAVVLSAMLWPGLAAAAECRTDEVLLRWTNGAARFSVEVADDADERARGLMFRDRMARGAGMLFVYEGPQTVAFWMKNTLIPLDMIFVGADGVVRHVHANAIPGDETSIPGGADILAVLEINGGLAKALGIGPGAQLRHPAFGAGSVWPC